MIRQCVGCPAKGLPDKAYRKADPEARKGLARMVARGLCKACYMRAQRADTLIDFERNTVSSEVIRDDWQHLADPLRTVKAECIRLAPQFGMDWRSLERAVYRAGIRSRAIA
jgi:hypothetical protein